MQVKIFPPQNVKFFAFEFEVVLAENKAFNVVAEIAFDVFGRRFVEFGELSGSEDGLSFVLNAREVIERVGRNKILHD